jgi:hypothetical protein
MTDEEIKIVIEKVDGLKGMTVNERLNAAGLIDIFNKSLKHDKDNAKRILEMLHVDKVSIDKILDQKNNAVTEEMRRNAYLKALLFKNTVLDEETIYARLEKQGFPVDLAKEVAKNVVMKKQIDIDNKVPNPLNSYSLWSKLLKAIFPKLKM